MSIEHTIRKMGWDRNKRTQGVPPRVDEASLKKARELHSAGEYEAALQLLENIKESPNDARAVRVLPALIDDLGFVAIVKIAPCNTFKLRRRGQQNRRRGPLLRCLPVGHGRLETSRVSLKIGGNGARVE